MLCVIAVKIYRNIFKWKAKKELTSIKRTKTKLKKKNNKHVEKFLLTTIVNKNVHMLLCICGRSNAKFEQNLCSYYNYMNACYVHTYEYVRTSMYKEYSSI